MEESFLRELKEDMQRDRLRQLWEQHGKFVIGLCVAVVLGTSAGVAWKHYRSVKNEAATSALLAALNAKDETARNKALTTVQQEQSGNVAGTLAALTLAAEAREKGDNAAAAEAYRNLTDGAAGDEALRALAQVLGAYSQLDAGKEPSVTDDVKEGQPFAYARREAAAWTALAAKDSGGASRFAALKEDEAAPQLQRQRMDALAAYIAPVDETPNQPPEE